MSFELLKMVGDAQKKKAVVDVRSGDTVRVSQKIKEGDKFRIQVFEGTVTRVDRKDSHTERITVRKVTSGVGVEKRALMAYQYDKSTLAAMAHIKQALDPKSLANPLKILPYRFAEKARMPLPLLPNVQVLQEKILSYCKNKTPFIICGANTYLKAKQKAILSADALQNIIDIDTDNYTATVQAGVTLKELSKFLRETAAYSVLPAIKGTVGGAFCSGMFPGFYEHVLGIEVLLPDGSYIRYGGKLMKNSAGYHLTRLLAGSQGTLGLVTQVTFKIFARPVPLLQKQKFEPGASCAIWDKLREVFDSAHLILNNKEENTRG